MFGVEPQRGNPVAVVLDAEGLDDGKLQRFANWTNLSETTFVLPADAGADYRVRIFTPDEELPFAGHPTLGTCHAWLESGGTPAGSGVVVQQCGAGLVAIRRDEGRLSFAAPPLRRSGPLDGATLELATTVLGVGDADVVDAAWVDNGPGWFAVLLADAEAVLAVVPRFGDVDHVAVGVVGPHPDGSPHAVEVRAFYRAGGAPMEDPVTGSLNASLAQWLLGTGRLTAPYVAGQGTALGRRGEVHVAQDGDGTVWVGGTTATVVTGTVDL